MAKGIVGTYDHDLNFWDIHPLFLTVPAFKKLKGRDRVKSENQEGKSSLIMWAFVLVYDTGDDNPFRNIPEEERKIEIASNILNKPNFKWEDYDYVLEALIPMVTTQPQRSRDELYNKLHKRDKFIDSTDFTLDSYKIDERTGKGTLVKGTADQLDKMLANTVKLYENLARIDNLILMEDSKIENTMVSESESGIM